MKRPIRIALTTGDTDGIGTEIVGKALSKIRPRRDVQYILWRSPRCPKKHLNLIDTNFQRLTVHDWPEALEKMSTSTGKDIIDIESNLSPPMWVEISATASLFKHIDGIATAPLSKTIIKAAGMKDIGHTDILKRVSKSKSLYMAFLGKKFNVLISSGHIPIDQVPKELTGKRIENAIHAANELRSILPSSKSKKPLALIGLNPHAGENGLIGTEEKLRFQKAIERCKNSKIAIDGPLVPDVAFWEENWKKYSVYVCAYHDQALIPFKMVHGINSGVHVTIGLPFIRTSVDHGTAKNIFGKNKADANSMVEAIHWAVQLCKQRSGKGTTF